MKFNITTFNLRLNHSADKENAWPYRIQSVVKYIENSKPLIIGTQEVLDGMLSDLTSNLPNYSYIGISRKQNEEYNPIFFDNTVLECKESATFWLSKTPYIPNSVDFDSACIRICTWAELIFKDDRSKRIRIFNTHLDHISELAKIEGIKIILEKIKEKNKIDNLPFILMGDFNSSIDDNVIKYLNNNELKLRTVLDYIPQENYGATFHGFTGLIEGHPIDYIYTSNDIKIHNAHIYKEKILNIYPSDHYPLTALIEI